MEQLQDIESLGHCSPDMIVSLARMEPLQHIAPLGHISPDARMKPLQHQAPLGHCSHDSQAGQDLTITPSSAIKPLQPLSQTC